MGDADAVVNAGQVPKLFAKISRHTVLRPSEGNGAPKQSGLYGLY